MVGHSTTAGHPANKLQEQLLKNKLFRASNLEQKATTFFKRFTCFLKSKNV